MTVNGVGRGLGVLAVDDERPALDELVWLLERSPLVGLVVAAGSAGDALRCLQAESFDAVLLDIRMPGFDGLELAQVLTRFSEPPAVVFVTAHEEYALAAFEVDAVGYLLKPVDAERLDGVLAKVAESRAAGARSRARDGLETVAAELAGRTVLVSRSEVSWVEASGDYVRLHTTGGDSHLVRIPLATLEERWGPHGFVRIHRGFLVALRAVRELRTEGSQTVVQVEGHELPVSRRQVRELRDRLVRATSRTGP